MATPELSSAVHSFLEDLKKIRVHQAKGANPSLKKPLLLLLVLAKIGRGEVKENRIRFSDVEQDLRGLITKHGGDTSAKNPNPEEPFYYLHTSPFWRVKLDESGLSSGRRKKASASLLRKPGSFASLEDALFDELRRSPDGVKAAVKAIANRWWPGGLPSALRSHLGL